MTDQIDDLQEIVEEKVEEAAEQVKKGVVQRLKEKFSSNREDLYLDNKRKGVLDAFQEKLISRKLLVFLTATGLLIGAGLDPDTWGMIAMFYIGGQSAIDAVQVWRHCK